MPQKHLIRPRNAADTPSIVALYNAQESDSLPQTLERYEAEHPLESPPDGNEQWVVEVEGDWAGYGSFHPAWWTEDPHCYSLELRVDNRFRRAGAGTRLYEQMQLRLLALGATRLLCWVREDSEAGRGFAQKMVFRETGQAIQECRLYTPEVAREAFAPAEARIAQSGIKIVTLEETKAWGEPFLHRLHALCTNADKEPTHASFLSWKAETLEAVGVSPQTYWVAVEEAVPVGLTFLKRLSREAAENDYTGVAPTHQGRGIATALKGRAIAWAQQQGVNWFYTSSEVGNAPMIAINTRLGYRPSVVRHEMEREIKASLA